MKLEMIETNREQKFLNFIEKKIAVKVPNKMEWNTILTVIQFIEK